MSETTNDQSGGATPSGPGTQGADSARAYVPPQTLKAKKLPTDIGETQKVQIKSVAEAGDKGTLPLKQPIPAEALAHAAAVGSRGGPATPFETAAPPHRVDNALPFQAPVAVGGATAVAVVVAPGAAASTHAVSADGGFTPKNAPLNLTGPGVLTPFAGLGVVPHTQAPQVASASAAAPPVAPGLVAPAPVTSAQVAPAQVAPAQVAPAQVAGSPVPAPMAEPAPVAPAQVAPAQAAGSPAGPMAEPAVIAPAPVTVPVGGGVAEAAPAEVAPAKSSAPDAVASDPTSGDENPLAVTNSPWTAPEKVEAENLPSADFLPSAQLSKAPIAPVVSTVEESQSGGSRTLMTVGLAVAALALVGAVVYFTIIDRSSSTDGPAKIDVGSEQRDYDMGGSKRPGAKPSATAKAAPKPPPKRTPVVAPKGVPRTVPRPPPAPRKKPEDIYDGL